MANQFLKLRRSSVPGKRPDTGSLDYGEIALNTYDGLAFMKKSGSNGEEVVAIGSTGSFTGSFSGSFYGTSSWSTYALSASSADDFLVRGTLTAQTIVVQVITSSTELVTGSLTVSGSLNAPGGITGSLLGTSSWADYSISSSIAQNAVTASYLTGYVSPFPFTGSAEITGSLIVSGSANITEGLTASLYGTSSWAENATSASIAQNAVTASYVLSGAVSASYATTSSFANDAANASSSSYALSASYTTTSSFADNTISASYSATSSTANSASFATQAANADSASYALTSSYTYNASNANSASYALDASTAISASFAASAANASSASFAASAANASSASFALDASTAISASFAASAANASSASFAINAANATSASYATFAATASSADNFNVRNTLTVTTIVAQTITSSTDFVTGSTRFGTSLNDTHQFTGSVSITGSLSIRNLTQNNLSQSVVVDISTGQLYYNTVVETTKSGNIAPTSFSGRVANVVFNNPFPTDNYSVSVSGGDLRVWTVTNKTMNGFRVSSNSRQRLTQPVFWIATMYG